MVKRLFDIFFSVAGLLFSMWLIIVLFIMACISTRQNGFFIQERIGQHGKPFYIIKIRSMRNSYSAKYVTRFGRFIRRYKLDELPQLFNVLAGNMSFVGPRPDVPGYYDTLYGDDAAVLKLKPGITGPASLKYANEEALLATKTNPLQYNDTVIFPDKVKINLEYLNNQSLWLDVTIIFSTIFNKKAGKT